jgi:putative acetyltransferase
MNHIRKATDDDLNRIAEIEVFNYRLNFYPIFQSDWFYFSELQVPNRAAAYRNNLDSLWVYDDGVVKGFMQVTEGEVKKLFVEPVLQGQSIGAKLLDYAIAEEGARWLWALEKNVKAITFYARHGFRVTGDKKPEEGTAEYLVRLER